MLTKVDTYTRQEDMYHTRIREGRCICSLFVESKPGIGQEHRHDPWDKGETMNIIKYDKDTIRTHFIFVSS